MSEERLLHFKQQGLSLVEAEGLALFILPGMLGYLATWRTLARLLGERYCVYSFDLRNHGESFHCDSMNYEVMASDVEKIRKHEGIQKVIVLGHSMGGKVAMTYAQLYSESVTAMVVLDMVPKDYRATRVGQDLKQLLLNLRDFNLSLFSSKIEIEKAFSDFEPDKAVRQFLLSNLYKNDQGLFYWKPNITSIAGNMDSLLLINSESWSAWEKKVLFIRGSRSEYILDRDSEIITPLFPHYQIKSIDSGHWVHIEQAKACLELIQQFIDSL